MIPEDAALDFIETVGFLRVLISTKANAAYAPPMAADVIRCHLLREPARPFMLTKFRGIR
jgi:hypothetical protein